MRYRGCKRRDENATIDDPAKLQGCPLETEKGDWQVVVKLYGDNLKKLVLASRVFLFNGIDELRLWLEKNGSEDEY